MNYSSLGIFDESETGNALRTIYSFLLGLEMYWMLLFSTLTLLILQYNIATQVPQVPKRLVHKRECIYN